MARSAPHLSRFPGHRVPRGGRAIVVGIALMFAAQSLRAYLDQRPSEPPAAAPGAAAAAEPTAPAPIERR